MLCTMGTHLQTVLIAYSTPEDFKGVLNALLASLAPGAQHKALSSTQRAGPCYCSRAEVSLHSIPTVYTCQWDKDHLYLVVLQKYCQVTTFIHLQDNLSVPYVIPSYKQLDK